MDNSRKVNVLLRTFPGLSLPPTTCFTISPLSTTENLLDHIADLLPPSSLAQLNVTTTSGHRIPPSQLPISSLVPSGSEHATSFLSLALGGPLRGGKGGFGSQLRAAGGRMSSRKRKNALASDPNNGVGSNRNLDGRRLRTITEAKNLAEYLANQPEMERREREEKRKRWEAIVEGAERREDEIKRGLGGHGRGKGLSDEWLEEKEDAGERTREAVKKAMARSGWKDGVPSSGGKSAQEENAPASSSTSHSEDASHEASDGDSDDMDLDEEEVKVLEGEAAQGDVDAIWVLKNQVKRSRVVVKADKRPKFVGFDEDDEFLSSSDSDREEVGPSTTTDRGKGKQKA